MESKVKIILVDDHTLFREGMKILIEIQGLGKVIAEAENGLELLDLLRKYNPDLVLLDINMPVMNGLEACVKAKAIKPNLKLLALTMYNDKTIFKSMKKAGFLGYLVKSSGKEDFEKAVKMVLSGHRYYP